MNPNRLKTKAKILAIKPEKVTNGCGFEPCGLKVLVLPDEIEEKTAGGIILIDTIKDDEAYAIESGTLVAVGGGAFTDWPNSSDKWPGKVPEVGDRVVISRYAGLIKNGEDGKKYKFINDTDICGFEV